MSKKYLDLAGLSSYDQKIKEYIDDGDVTIDSTLTQAGQAADAKKVGDEISDVKSAIDVVEDNIDLHYDSEDLESKTEYINSAYINSSGVITNSSSWRLRYILVSSLKTTGKLIYKSTTTSNSYYQIAYYSTATPSNDGFISGVQYTTANVENTAEIAISDIPDNAVCIGITYLNASPHSLVWTATTPTSKVDEIEAISDNINYGYRDTDITSIFEYKNSAYIDSSGVINSSTSWRLWTIQISELPPYSEITVKSYTTTSGRYQIAFYSSREPNNNTFLQGGYTFTASGYNERTITVIPDTAVCMAVTNYVTSGDFSVSVKSATEVSDVDALEDTTTTLTKRELAEQRAKFDNQFNYIAYSGFSVAGKGVNTAEHYEWAAQHKYTAIKGDVQIASDDVIVMCHDAGFTIDANNQITTFSASDNVPIRSRTSSEWFAMTYTNGYHPCGIDALIRTCKLYGKIAFVTVRSDYLDYIFPALFDCLDTYSMRERTIINGFSHDTMKKARKYDKSIMLSWVQTKNHQLTTQDVDAANALGNCLITCYDYSGDDQTTITNQDPTVLKYAQSKDIRIYEAIIGYNQYLNNTLFDAGVTGAQLECIPDIFEDFA